MHRTTAAMLCALALAACSDGTSGSITSGGELSDIPADLLKNITAVSYDAGNERLVLRMDGIDGGPQDLVYTRTPALDIGPYEAYTYQDDPLDRHFTAMVAESHDGSVIAGAVADGGQFNKYFGGGFYQRASTSIYSPPTTNSGQVSYAGTYAGVTNRAGPGTVLLPPPVGTDTDILPLQSARVQGKIFLNVNFGDNAVNGSVYDRTMADYGTALPTLALVKTSISDEGVFNGVVEIDIRSGGVVNNTVGAYGGIFGGQDASSVAGVLKLDDIDNNIYNWTNDEEIGVFVLTQCNQPGHDAAACATVK